MNSLFLSFPPLPRPSSSNPFLAAFKLTPQHIFIKRHPRQDHQLSSRFSPYRPSRVQSSIGDTTLEGKVGLASKEEMNEKDWSFLDFDSSNCDEASLQNIDRIISAGEIAETSRVLVSIGSEGFVDRLVESTPLGLLYVVHDSIFVLAGIKEMHDDVKCWQGEVTYVPESWGPLNAVFLYFMPALSCTIGDILEGLTNRCSPGARVVISHPKGREILEQERKQYPETVVSDLPEKKTLEEVAAQHSFDVVEYKDEPGFYLAVLKARS